MRTDEIQELLKRYEEGCTSEQEERELFRFFSEEEVPACMQADKAYFGQLNAWREEEAEHRLSALIDRWEAEEKHRPWQRKHAMHALRRQWWAGIAAGVALLFAAGLYLYEMHLEPEQEPVCLTPEEAYRETEKALVLFSATLNKGLKEMEAIPQVTGKMQETIQEQLNQLKIGVKP